MALTCLFDAQHKGNSCEEQAGKLAGCVLGQDTSRDASTIIWQTGSGAKSSTRRGGIV